MQRYKSVKKILKPAGASRKFEALLERQENFEAKNVSQDFYGVGNFCLLDIWLDLSRFVPNICQKKMKINIGNKNFI